MRGPAWQKACLRVHWALGLFAGGLFVLIGLTGSALVFYQAIDEWLNPVRFTTNGRGVYHSFDDMAGVARTARPDVPGPYGLFLPQARDGVVVAWFTLPGGGGADDRDLEVTLDPYSGEVLSRDRIWGQTLVSFVYELHKGLWLGRTGEVVVAGLACALFLSVATGLYLWWPTPGKVRQAFTVRADRSTIRRHYDLHKLSGLAGVPQLLMLACTGFYLECPEVVISAVSRVAPIQHQVEWHSKVGSEAHSISIDRAVAVAKDRLPSGEVKWIGLPQQPRDAFQVGLRQPEEPRYTSGESIVWVDQYSSAILHVRDWRTLMAGDRFLAWLFPLHNGEAFGLAGRWIVFVSGFIPLVLYVTALRMWWLKREAHRRRRI